MMASRSSLSVSAQSRCMGCTGMVKKPSLIPISDRGAAVGQRRQSGSCAQFAALAQASICSGSRRWAHAVGPSVRADLDEEIARADVVQLEDRVTIACENNIAR